MHNLFPRNISKSTCSIVSLSHMYNTLSLKSSFNIKRAFLEPLSNIIKYIQEEHAKATVKKVMSKDFCKFVMKYYGCKIINRSLLFVPSREVIQMFSSTSSKHFYLSTVNQRKLDPNTLTFVVYNKILHDFLKINFERKKIGEFFNGPGYITKFCRSLQNSNAVEQYLGTVQVPTPRVIYSESTNKEAPGTKMLFPFAYLRNYKVIYLDYVLDKYNLKDVSMVTVLPQLNQEPGRIVQIPEIYYKGFAEREHNEGAGIKPYKSMFSTKNNSKPKRQMWKITNQECSERLEHLQRARKQSINTNQQFQQPDIYAQQTETKSDCGIVKQLQNSLKEEAVLSKSSIQIPVMLEQPELSKKLNETRCYENNDFGVNITQHQKLNLSPIKTPTFTVTKRYFKKDDQNLKRTKIPSQVCKDVKLNSKKKSSNEKKIPAQACKDKVAYKKAKRDASTFFQSMNTGRLATPEMKTKKLKIIVSRYQFTTDNKPQKPTQKVGASKRISIPKAPNPQQKMTYKNKIKNIVEPAKLYIGMIKVAGEIKMKNIKDQITQNLNELKNNPKEFLKSILLEQPEKEINNEKSKTLNLEKKETKLATITDQLKVESKTENHCTFFKIPPVDKKPLIEKMKDSLETSIETDFKQTFGNSFKQSKSKITLKALENLTKKEADMKLLAIDKPPSESNKQNLSKKQYFFKNEGPKRKEDVYLLQVQNDEDVKERKGVIDEGLTANETFLKKNWLLSKDNYCGEAVKKSWFLLSKEMDERNKVQDQRKREMLFKNMSKITRLIQPEDKKNDLLYEVEVFSSQEKKESPLNHLEPHKNEDNLLLLDKEERCASGEKTSKSNTKQEGMSKELIKQISDDDKSTNTNNALLAQVRNENNTLPINEDSALIGKREPDRFERPFITPSHVPPPKKEEEEKKKKFPPQSPKGGMILPPRNVSDSPKLINTEISKSTNETKLPKRIKDDLNSAKLELSNKESTDVLSKNKDKELKHHSKVESNLVDDNSMPIYKKIKDVKELKQPKEIIIENKSKVEIFTHLPRKAKDKLVYAKDSDLKKLITLEDKEHLRHNLRYILTLIEELDIEYKDGSDENLIKQSQEMDKIDQKRPKKLSAQTEGKLNNSVSKVVDKTNDLTKLDNTFQEKSSSKVPTQEQDLPDRKTTKQKADKRLGSSKENTKAQLSTSSKTLETPEENTKVKFSPTQDPTKFPHFSGYKRGQLQQQNKHFDTTSKENEKHNIFNQNTSQLERKNAVSTLMDFYHLDEETTSHEPLIQKPKLDENNPDSSLMHFYLLDEDDRIPEKSVDDPKKSNFPQKSEFQGIQENKQGVLTEKSKNKVTFIKTKNMKTILPGDINKEGFKTNTFNIKEYQGIKETKQGILIEKQKNKLKNNTFKNFIKSKGVSKTKGDSIPENEQKNENIKSIKPTSTTRSLTSSSKDKITSSQQKDLEKLLAKEENKFSEEKYICNLHKTEKLLSYNHGVKLVFGGCYVKDKLEETDGISTLTDVCWKLHSDIDGNRKYLFTPPCNFEEKTKMDITLTSDKDDDIPPTKIKSDKDKEKHLKKKERAPKRKKTTNDQTLKVTPESKQRMKAPITIKGDPNKTPLVTVIYSKKRQIEKSNKGVKERKREKVVYKVNKKRAGSSTKVKTRSRKRKKQKRRNIILFLLKDEIKRNEDWQAQIMDSYMTPKEKVDQALNKYKFNTPTEVSNDFNTIPSADLEMNQRKRIKERLSDSFYKNLQKTLFNARRVPKAKSDAKSDKEKEVSSKEKDKNETNSMSSDSNSKSGSTYETKHISKTDKTNITTNDNDSTLQPKSMYNCLSPGNISVFIK